MGASIIQLVATGIQDLYLIGDPQITFFKLVYRRHTNFAIESVIQNFSSPADFGQTVTCTISRSGDLVGKIFLYVELPDIPKFINKQTDEESNIKKIAWVSNLGYALIKDIFIEIGSQVIDKHYGEFLYIWSQLTNRKQNGLNKMIGNIPSMYNFSNGKSGYKLYIPLEFWFCKEIGLALPIVALSNSLVKITVSFRKLEECCRIGPTNSIQIIENVIPFKEGDYIEQTVNGQSIKGYVMSFDYLTNTLYYIKIVSPTSTKKTFESFPTQNNQFGFRPLPINFPKIEQQTIDNTPYRIYKMGTNHYVTPQPGTVEINQNVQFDNSPSFSNSFLYVDYIYLDNAERTKFIKSTHEYLIDQIQLNQEIGITNTNVKMNLALNHPSKSMYWVAQLDSLVGPGTINQLFNYTNLPGNDGIGLVMVSNLILNGQSRFGDKSVEYTNLVYPYQYHSTSPDSGINMFSFSLYPEKHQPSSTINMNRIDTINLLVKLDNSISSNNTAKLRVYTLNYNILRIYCNMGGLAFV